MIFSYIMLGPDRVSKCVKQSSNVWPFCLKLFGVLVLIFTTSFDILSNNLFLPNNFSFDKHLLYRQPVEFTRKDWDHIIDQVLSVLAPFEEATRDL